MTYQRLAYDDQDTAVKMHTDCDACAAELGPVPSIHFADFPREINKPEITVSDAAAHLASRMHLHLS